MKNKTYILTVTLIVAILSVIFIFGVHYNDAINETRNFFDWINYNI